MKKFLICLVLVIFIFSFNLFAEEAVEAPAEMEAVKSEALEKDEIPQLEGLALIGYIYNSGPNLAVQYWTKYIGLEFSTILDKDYFNVDNVGDSESLFYGFILAPLVGYQIDRFKPALNLGFSYSYEKDQANNITSNNIYFNPEVNLDIMVTDHLILKFGIVTANVSLYGNYDDGTTENDANGWGIEVFNHIGFGYKF